jgi:hypothetical protein
VKYYQLSALLTELYLKDHKFIELSSKGLITMDDLHRWQEKIVSLADNYDLLNQGE